MRRFGAAMAALLMAVVLVSPTAQAAEDIADALERVPGLTVVSEGTAPAGFRFFKLTFTQPADHRRPGAGSFEQRLALLHRDVKAPMVMYTSGYNVSENPNRSEPTQLVDGNQLSMEYRYFTPSRPEPADWSRQLTIWQAAADQHRVAVAFKGLYGARWLATGGSKGGMTAVYFRRFYPADVDGTIAYVAPNDVIDGLDVYDRFLSTVGDDPACRDALRANQRESLKRRDELGALASAEAAAKGYTFDIVGSQDKAMEIAIVDSYFTFWQYQTQADCASVPGPSASTAEIFAFYVEVESLNTYADQELAGYVPYYYQAAVQLGAPRSYERHLRDLLRYPGTNVPATFVPSSVALPRFDPVAMPDVDFWVRTRGSELLFVNGENDPWGAEPFQLGRGTRDSYFYTVPSGNHGAKISQLPAADAAGATATIRRWAAVDSVTTHQLPTLDSNPVLETRPRL
ncbi:S28 family serine protease [Amycolatopsis magusensis]|uniref:S28 family serine protease n=1 Tax=Amycolatopsis magusensis TaxID=882444 RepID=UPI0024A86A41|nr:S28 family serine protease [Amycolatopsis magusensis]MDI5976409.1 S28 family serine protease [Amycolatopsis magusensis]